MPRVVPKLRSVLINHLLFLSILRHLLSTAALGTTQSARHAQSLALQQHLEPDFVGDLPPQFQRRQYYHVGKELAFHLPFEGELLAAGGGVHVFVDGEGGLLGQFKL